MIKGLMFLSTLALCACQSFHALTSIEMEQRGTRILPDTSVEKVVHASDIALKNLGFAISQKELQAESGMVKTAPREIMVTASSTSNYSRVTQSARSQATVTRDEMAWVLNIYQEGKDVRVSARPRAFRNGDEIIGKEVFVAQVVDPKFQALWQELTENLKTSK